MVANDTDPNELHEEGKGGKEQRYRIQGHKHQWEIKRGSQFWRESLLPFQVYILPSSCTLDVSVLQTIGQKIFTIKRGASLSRANGQENSFEKEIFDKKLKETK